MICNIGPPNFCCLFTPTVEPLFVLALRLRHQQLFVEGPIGGSFWGAFTEDPYWKDIFGNALILYIPVQIRALFVEGFLLEAHSEGHMKKASLQVPYEEAPWAFTEDPYWKNIFGNALSCTFLYK